MSTASKRSISHEPFYWEERILYWGVLVVSVCTAALAIAALGGMAWELLG